MEITEELEAIGVYKDDRGKLCLSPTTFAEYITSIYEIIYTPSQQFYVYENGVYVEKTNDEFKAMLYSEISNYGVTCLWHVMLERTYVEAIKHMTYHGEPLNPYKHYINFRNCLLNINTLKTRTHSIKCYSTVQLPIKYNPKAKCPKFLKFLNDVFQNDSELIAVVQEIMGYCISADNHAQCFFVFYGSGANGKSVLCNIMKSLVGERLCASIPISDLSKSFSRALLKDKTLNISTENEAPRGQGYNSEYIKKISGGDDIQAEFKGKNGFSFRPICKLVFAVNTLPQFSDKSHGFMRRIKIIPFNARFSIADGTADIHLEEKLNEEISGIINWALKGLSRLRNNNYQFTESKAVNEIMDEYSKTINPYIVFWQEEVIKHPQEDNVRMKRTEFYKGFIEWCRSNNHTNLAKVNPRKFWNDFKLMLEQLKQKPVEVVKSNGEWYVKNYSFKNHSRRIDLTRPIGSRATNYVLDDSYDASMDDDEEEI